MTSNQSQPGQTRVVGTAGHVDHGKSTLVKALTGIDPDRLAEEKARAMTIDLGFAWLTLPSGRDVSIIDVPGHERFIKNMLAGVGGIDAAVLVVAADEGPMPQTTEHLAILDLLQVKLGVVALTKIDLVDHEWLDLVTEEVRERLAGSTLEGAQIVPVSAQSGKGLPELLTALDAVLEHAPDWPSSGRPRLPIDRVFTVSGFGTVVTGTLLGGELAVGQELRVFPSGHVSRIRGLQSHGAKVERSVPGSRSAVNLTGLAVDDVRRGDVLAVPGFLTPSHRLDARLQLLPDAPVTLEQNDEVDFFVGAAELPARVTILDQERIAPGEHGWVQFRFRHPVAVLKGDRYIVRRPSPSITIGGGEIVDPNPARHKRFRREVIESLETLVVGSPDEIVLQALASSPRELRSLRNDHPGGLAPAQVDAALAQLIEERDVVVLGGNGPSSLRPATFLVAVNTWEMIVHRLRNALAVFHAAQPLRRGIPREELRSRMRLTGPPRLFDEVLATASRDGAVVDDGQTVRRRDFAIVLDPPRRAEADRFVSALRSAPNAPPAPSDFGIDQETLGALVDLGEVVKVADGVVYEPAAISAIERQVIELIDRDGSLTLAGFRDHFDTSRKYAQAMLEYLDQRKVTRRVGDERVRFGGEGNRNGSTR
ncbi:MAG: selenocysteine-specific translation elongation factor [Thermomicrobiales bacterium]